MKEILKDRKLLHYRHRLSHEQIDQLLGENRAKEFLQEKMRRMDSIKHFLEITDILKEAGISFVSIKGPLLSYRIYGDASVRFSHDIDLLVEADSLDVIITLMREAHYELSEGVFWSDDKFKQDIIRQSTHHLSFFNKELEFCVEIHWTLTVNSPIHKDVTEKLLKQNLTTMNFVGRNFIVLNKEFELTYLIIHGSKHKWSRLKWLVDIKDYPVEDLNLNKWETLIKSFHAERILGQTNHLLFHYFCKKLPIEGSKKLPAFFIKYAETSLESPIDNTNSFHILLRGIWYQRLLFPQLSYQWSIFKSFFSRPGDVAVHDFSSKTAYYLYRPYSFIKRRIFHV
ncbi:MAG: nucleotidyltransferase family protein [Bacteroidales bacterium]|nr:nucleotidyltransferase family protein [Bacteroidales bacterium]